MIKTVKLARGSYTTPVCGEQPPVPRRVRLQISTAPVPRREYPKLCRARSPYWSISKTEPSRGKILCPEILSTKSLDNFLVPMNTGHAEGTQSNSPRTSAELPRLAVVEWLRNPANHHWLDGVTDLASRFRDSLFVAKLKGKLKVRFCIKVQLTRKGGCEGCSAST